MRYIIILSTLLLSHFALSQRNAKDSIIAAPWISVNYGLNATESDLKDRHGFFNHIGMFAGYKTKRNWIFGIDGNYMFGRQVRVSNMFDHLVDSKGNITDQNGDIAIVLVYSRGMCADVNVGKIFPVLSPNENSGIYVNFGVGYTVHKIRVETQDHVVPQLELDYKKGYDRLSAGFNTQQLIGYSFMANQGFLNFYGGFYCQQAYTYNKRTLFYDTPGTPPSTDMMLDIQYGVKVAWLIPVYKRKPKDFYFN